MGYLFILIRFTWDQLEPMLGKMFKIMHRSIFMQSLFNQFILYLYIMDLKQPMALENYTLSTTT